MVIGEITTEKPFEMALVKDNHVIQTLPVNATNDAFDIGFLPRAPRCGGAFFYTQTAYAFSKLVSIDCIAIAQQISRRGIPMEKLQRAAGRSIRRSDALLH